MRKAAALLLAAALCLGLCACKEDTPPPVEETPEQTVTPAPLESIPFTLAYDPTQSLHPITGSDPVNRMLNSLVYEGLYEVDENFVFHPVLAGEATVDESGLVWTILPAEGVTFSDGTPLEASHIVSSLSTARKSQVYSSRLSNIVSVRASKGKVVITLSQPNGALPYLLDVPIVLDQSDGAPPLGTGRYQYVWNPDNPYLMARDSNMPYTVIYLYPVSGTDERISAFDSGAVSMVTTDSLSPYSLVYSSSCEAWDYTTTDLIYVGFRIANGPCQSAEVRKAFSKAFDRIAAVNNLPDGKGVPTSLPIDPGHSEWDQLSADMMDYDMDSAAQLLQDTGYTKKADGLLYQGRSKTPLTVSLLVNSDNGTKVAIAEDLADSLRSLGVTVNVKSLPWDTYKTELAKGNFDLYIGEVRLTADFDITPLLSGSLNYGGYDITPIAEQHAAWVSAGGEARTWLAKCFWLLFADEAPFAPLCFTQETMLVHWNSISNLSPIRTDPFYRMEDWIVP